MSYEFFGRIEDCPQQNLAVLGANLKPITDVVSFSDSELLLRWSGMPVRDESPVDVTMSFGSVGLSVVFRTGTADSREVFLHRIVETIQELYGRMIVYEEV